jgi:hypothetical protein
VCGSVDFRREVFALERVHREAAQELVAGTTGSTIIDGADLAGMVNRVASLAARDVRQCRCSGGR